MRPATRNLLLVAAFAGVIGVAAWLRTSRRVAETPLAQSAPKRAFADVAAPPQPEVRTALTATIARERIRQAVLSGDRLEWSPLVWDLLKPAYSRDEALGILVELLENQPWDVRVTAAYLLLELGSYRGVPVLQAALREAAEGRDIPAIAVAAAATKLHRYRQPINGDTLYLAYQRFKEPELLNVAIMQQVPQLNDVVRDKWSHQKSGYETGYIAALLDLKDADAVAHYQRLASSSDPKNQLLGHWALFRATGDESHLNWLVSTLEQAVGLGGSNSSAWGRYKAQEFDFLQITPAPKATAALRDVADHAAQQSNGGVNDFNRAFTALFYLHHDYEFVDERLLDYFSGRYSGTGIDRGLMMRIAAARNTPELRTAARAFNAAAYEYEFNAMQHRPLEQWVDLRHVPVSIAPPLTRTPGG